MMWSLLRTSILFAIISFSHKDDCFAGEAVGDQDAFAYQNGNCLNLNERMPNIEAENRQQKQELSQSYWLLKCLW